MSLRFLLIISGGLEARVGVLALVSPVTVVSLLLGSPPDLIGAVLARIFGAGVFSLGLACLKARNDVGTPASLAVSLGITAHNVLAAVVMIWASRGRAIPVCGKASIFNTQLIHPLSDAVRHLNLGFFQVVSSLAVGFFDKRLSLIVLQKLRFQVR